MVTVHSRSFSFQSSKFQIFFFLVGQLVLQGLSPRFTRGGGGGGRRVLRYPVWTGSGRRRRGRRWGWRGVGRGRGGRELSKLRELRTTGQRFYHAEDDGSSLVPVPGPVSSSSSIQVASVLLVPVNMGKVNLRPVTSCQPRGEEQGERTAQREGGRRLAGLAGRRKHDSRGGATGERGRSFRRGGSRC